MEGMQQFSSTQWDQQVQALGGGILQSSVWREFQERVGRGSVQSEELEKWIWQGFIRQSKGLKYLMIPYGPVVLDDTHEALRAIELTADEQGVDFVRLEPIGAITESDMWSFGAHQIHEIDPQHTAILDLTKSDEELRRAMQSGHRNLINTAEKRGISIERIDDLSPMDDFLRLLADTARFNHITNLPDSYYRHLAETLIDHQAGCFYVSRVERTPASISLVYDWGGTRTYAYAANDQALNRQYKVAVAALWRMIVDAKSSGMQHFDFWGVAPEDQPDHKWAGITKFKMGFGGERVSTIGTWDMPIKRYKYRAYQAYRSLRRMDS